MYCIYNTSVKSVQKYQESLKKKNLKFEREFEAGFLDMEIITLEARVEIMEVDRNLILA